MYKEVLVAVAVDPEGNVLPLENILNLASFKELSERERLAEEKVKRVADRMAECMAAGLSSVFLEFNAEIKRYLGAVASFQFDPGMNPQLVLIVGENFLDLRHERVYYPDALDVRKANAVVMEELIEDWFGTNMRRMDVGYGMPKKKPFTSVTRYDFFNIGGRAQPLLTKEFKTQVWGLIEEWSQACDEKHITENAVQMEWREKFPPRASCVGDPDDREWV